MKIKISSGNIHAVADLGDTPTAKVIYNALPIEASAIKGDAKIFGKVKNRDLIILEKA